MYQQPWGQGQPQPHPGTAQQVAAAQPWSQQPGGQPQGDPGAYVAHGQAGVAPAWGAQPAAAAAPVAASSSAPGVQTAAQIAAYQQYYQQQAAGAGGAAVAAAPPSSAAYYSSGAPAAAHAQPGVRTWTGTVTHIIPPNYGVIDGDAYYINAVVVGEIPRVRMRHGKGPF